MKKTATATTKRSFTIELTPEEVNQALTKAAKLTKAQSINITLCEDGSAIVEGTTETSAVAKEKEAREASFQG